MNPQCDERLKTADATAVFGAHRLALERLAARITGDREDARDVVADAFAALLEAGPSDPSHVVPWLYLTVRRRAYNRIRTRVRAQRRLPKLAASADTPTEPDSVLRRDARINALLAGAAGHLSDRDRVAVLLRHLHQAPYDEVATALGTTPAQARVVVHRATARLRHHVVTTLSRRHEGVPEALSDEVVALLQGALLLPLSRPARMANTAREWWRRAQSATTRAAVYVGEALGPAAALVAVTAAPAAPAVVVTAVSASELAPVPAPALAPVTTTQPAARPTAAPSAQPAPPLTLSAPSVASSVTIGAPLVHDDPGTTPSLAQSIEQHPRSLLDVLGLPVDLPDPLDAPQGPEVDIRSLEVATLAGPDGRPAAVRWRVRFDAPLPSNATVGLSWGFDGRPCYASFGWHGAVDLFCSEHSVAGANLLYQGVSRAKPHVHVDGAVVDVTLPFAALDDIGRRLLRPGARLVNVMATASCYVNYLDRSGCENGDQAPNDWNGSTYRIEE